MLTSRARTPFVVAVVALAAVGLAGCASATPAEAPEPTTTADSAIESTPTPAPDAEPVLELGPTIAGTGPNYESAANLPVPAGAHSVSIEFTCEGGQWFSVDLGDSMQQQMGSFSGECGTPASFVWPVTERTTAPLRVTVPGPDTAWTATPTFSSAEFRSDEAIDEDCEAFSEVYSAFMNADVGYTLHDAYDETEWRDLVNGALDDLVTLSDTAESDLGDRFAQYAAEVSAPHHAIGEAVMVGEHPALTDISAACNANHTPLVVVSEFGG